MFACVTGPVGSGVCFYRHRRANKYTERFRHFSVSIGIILSIVVMNEFCNNVFCCCLIFRSVVSIHAVAVKPNNILLSSAYYCILLWWLRSWNDCILSSLLQLSTFAVTFSVISYWSIAVFLRWPAAKWLFYSYVYFILFILVLIAVFWNFALWNECGAN